MRGLPVSKFSRCSGARVHVKDTPVVSIRNFIGFVLPHPDRARSSACISSEGQIGHCYGHIETFLTCAGAIETNVGHCADFGIADPRQRLWFNPMAIA
jgi:hypothetical protein